MSFERFKRWRLRIPGAVKLWESPGKAGGLPVIIMDAFDIPKTTLKNHLTKLMTLDEKFYKIEGMDARVASGNVKFSSTGLRLSPTLLANYGFKQGDEFKVSCLEEGKIVLEKK